MGSTDTPSKCQLACAAGRSTPSASMMVARKSVLTTVAHETRAGPAATAGHETMPGTRWPPSCWMPREGSLISAA